MLNKNKLNKISRSKLKQKEAQKFQQAKMYRPWLKQLEQLELLVVHH
jgi:hypothetical protein